MANRLRLLLPLLMLLQSTMGWAASSNAWDCPIPVDLDFVGYAECMQAAADTAVNDAIEELQNSPMMAQLPAEQALLAMARDGGLNDMAQCLNQAGIQFGTVVGNAVNNPWNLVENRLTTLMADAVAKSADRVNGVLARISAGDVQALNHANVALIVDEAYALMMDAAAADPVASCALPMLNNQAQLTKQVAVQAFSAIEQQTQILMQTTIQPAINNGTAVLMSGMLQQMRAEAAPVLSRPGRFTVPAGGRAPAPRLPAASAGKPRQQTKASNRTASDRNTSQRKQFPANNSKQAGRSSNTSQNAGKSASKGRTVAPPPRTRAGATFMSDASQMAADGLQTVVGAVVPNEVQRIALAEFTARTLDPESIRRINLRLNALTDALNRGVSTTSVNLDDLDSLIAEISLSNEALYSEIALATIKFYGHEVIDTVGEGLVDYAVGTLGGVEAALDNVVAAICSVASLPSGVPCSIVKGIVSFLYQQALVPTLNIAATAAVHAAWEMTADCGADAVRAGLNPATAQGCGETIASTLRWFPATATQAVSYVMPHLDETQAALLEYHTAVSNLATAAGG